MVHKCRYRELVALVLIYRLEDTVYILNECALARNYIACLIVSGICPISRNFNLLEVFHTTVNGSVVHIYDSLTFLHI